MNVHSRPQSTIALIPAFNEARFIGSVVLAARGYVDHVVVIDDGSSDETAQIACKAGAMVIQHQRNKGKAAAVNTGFAYARRLKPLAVVMIDGDGQHLASDIPAVLEPIRCGNADIVLGSRHLTVRSEIPRYRKVGQFGLTAVTNVASGVRVTDSQSGFRAFSQAALDVLTFSGNGGFSIESEMQFQIRDYDLRLVEAPINVIYAEKAKRNPFAQGWQVLKGIAGMVRQTRPLLYCSFISAVLLAFSFMTSVVMIESSPRLFTGMVTTVLAVLGMVVFFAGLVLHATRSMLQRLQTVLLERVSEPYVEQTKLALHIPDRDDVLVRM